MAHQPELGHQARFGQQVVMARPSRLAAHRAVYKQDQAPQASMSGQAGDRAILCGAIETVYL